MARLETESPAGNAIGRWVSVHEDDLVDLLRAARQLRATPLVTEEVHARLGRVIDRVLARIDPAEAPEFESPTEVLARRSS